MKNFSSLIKCFLTICLLLSISSAAISAPTPPISGTVVDDENRPLAGWTVKLSSSEKSKPTNEKGYWAFESVASGGDYTLTLEPTNGYNYYLPHSGQFRISLGTKPQSYTFKVTRRGAIVGSVKYDDGTPMKNWTLTLNKRTTTSNVHGEWGFPYLNPGHHQVVLTLEKGYSAISPKASADKPPVISQKVTIKTNETVAMKPFIVAAKPSVTISVSAFPSKPLKDWVVKLKVKGSQDILQTGKTDKNGQVSFNRLDLKEYTALLEVKKGFVSATPSTNSLDFDIKDPKNSSLSFRLGRQGSIYGTVYQERAKNQIILSESPRLKNWKVYLDQNNNHKFDEGELFSLTDQQGAYVFDAVGTGSFSVQAVLQDNWNFTQPTTKGYKLKIHSRFQQEHKNFGVQQFAKLSGIVFEDKNKNGSQDSDETGLPNWTVSLDIEGTPLTVQSDKDGKYKFDSIVQGIHTLSAKPIKNISWKQTNPLETKLNFEPSQKILTPNNDKVNAAYDGAALATSKNINGTDLPAILRASSSYHLVSDGPTQFEDYELAGLNKKSIQWSENSINYGRSYSTLSVVDLDVDGFLDVVQPNQKGRDGDNHFVGDRHLFLMYGGIDKVKKPITGSDEITSYVVDFITPDQFPDIVILSSNGSKIQLVQNLGKRNFKVSDVSIRDEPVWDILTLDIDRDGFQDLVSVMQSGVYLAKNDGSGNFGVMTKLIAGSFYKGSKMVSSDFNQDNLGDLVVVNTSPTTNSLATNVYLNDKNNSFFRTFKKTNGGCFTTYTNYARPFISDIDNDGNMDLITCSKGIQILGQIHLNKGNGLFLEGASTNNPFTSNELYFHDFFDITGDTLPDHIFSETTGVTRQLFTETNASTRVPGPSKAGYFAGKAETIDIGVSLNQ